MEIQTINRVHKFAKIGLFVCWLGLSFSMAFYFLQVPRFDVIEMIAYIANQLNIFSNLKGGQPYDPTDFVMQWN